MDDLLRDIAQQIERTRRRLHKAGSPAELMLISRRMDSLINQYIRLSGDGGFVWEHPEGGGSTSPRMDDIIKPTDCERGGLAPCQTEKKDD